MTREKATVKIRPESWLLVSVRGPFFLNVDTYNDLEREFLYEDVMEYGIKHPELKIK